jgi:hypothetical protein
MNWGVLKWEAALEEFSDTQTASCRTIGIRRAEELRLAHPRLARQLDWQRPNAILRHEGARLALFWRGKRGATRHKDEAVLNPESYSSPVGG